MTNIDIFELLYEPLKLKPPIKMFEAFSGIGTQAMALKRLGVPYEIVGFSEIDKYAIQSYHAIHGDVANYGDITKMTEIPSCDIFTWSFPCTDLSKAGKRQGMTKDTRSGLVYEVLRLVRDTKNKPKVLIMENVPDLIQATFVKEFGEIQYELETYGYMNYVETLNSKDYGVAQNRNRVFMVSILGKYSYNFPQPFKLEKRLKDYLEQDVDEKFYIDDFKSLTKMNDNYSQLNGGKWDKLHDIGRRVYSDNFISPTIHTMQGGNLEPKVIMIPEDTKQGYALAHDGDGVYIDRPEQKRGVVQKGMIQTIKTNTDTIGVVVKTNNKRLNETIKEIKDDDTQFLDAYNRSIHKDITPTITTRIDASNSSFLYNDLRIRKLTPRETWRLMGCSDDDFDKAQKVCSNSQLYKQAGNAIVVDVFENILRSMI